jgi:hypothetical protein
VALAGDHAQTRTETWRAIAGHVYQWSLAGVAVSLLVFFPLHFDLKWTTMASVAVVAVFLVIMERPMQTAATTVAPLTAIIGASAVVFGSWAVLLATVAITAIRVRIALAQGGLNKVLSSVALGSVALAVISGYSVVATWDGASRLIALAPSWSHSILTVFGIIAVGLAWQTVNNFFAYFWYLLNGNPFVISQLFRTGIIASIYAYLLVAMYKFGGVIATTIFYVVVAQIKVLQDVLGVTAQLHKLDKAGVQARGLVLDLIRFTDVEHVDFSKEVQNISQMMGRHLGLPKKDVELLGLAAELHEMGKAHLSARLRLGRDLNAKEMAQQRTYTRWGGLMVRAADALLPQQIADWIEFHGEHFDGTGSPRGLQGEDIPLPSRIITVARDYVKHLTGYDGAQAVDKEKALALLRGGSGTLYDPRLVKLLYELVS